MCISTNFIEQQAYEMSEKIKKNSLYKFVGVAFSGSDSSSFNQNQNWNGSGLITKVNLEDKDGTSYIIEPNSNGLRFAQGEITFSEYKKLQRKENYFGYTLIFMILGFFSVIMFTLMKFVA
ncbi:hypothetical protein PY093_13235 [Cytobacillus sp. S13-E01]|uniref:hypothetical protein n=1 Tax=Cytobacillus sp. S13-E01 TaxID=3031326 RepID=UPI0023D7E129|nr:hypothetical protein [Cytobacillus sp. S13-E01]MDF0727651.1 hypothetical protein [Cytobacillus sp. S13-E01]